jgi:hypothetical protein
MMWAQTLFYNKFVLQHDIILHLRWALQFQTALHEGVLLPRWASASHGGLGDPTFLYYQPLFYYLSSFLNFIGYSQTRAFVVAVMVPSIFSGSIVFSQMLRMYSPSRAMLGMAMLVTCPALFFLSTQYGAFPWVMSTPFCILFALESSKDRPDPIRSAIWLSLICLSHLLSGLIVLMCTAGARLIFRFPTRGTLADNFQWILGVILGLCLAAFFVYPAITQQNLINPSAWTNDPTLDWHPSFAFSTFTYLRYGVRWFLIQWPLPIFALLMCLLVLVITKKNAALGRVEPGGALPLRLGIIALVGLACSSELAYPLFDILPPLQKLQWPYRFVILSIVLGSLAFAGVANLRPLGNIKRTWLQYGCLGAVLLHLCFVMFLQWSLFTAGKPLPAPGDLMKGEFGQPEYLVAQRGTEWLRYNKEGQLAGECSRLGVHCESLLRESHSSSIRITSPYDVTVRLPIFAFPGWLLVVDGRQEPIFADPEAGLISVKISPGTHEVRTSWVGIPAERVGKLISIAALALVIACILLRTPFIRTGAKVKKTRRLDFNTGGVDTERMENTGS